MIWKEAGVQIEEVEKHLSTLKRIIQHFEAIKDLISKHRAESYLAVILVVKAVCEKVLFSDYEYLSSAATIVSIMTLLEIKKEESNIPTELQPKVQEIKGYCDKIEAQSKKLESLMQKIIKKIDKAGENEYKISEADKIGFQMDVLDLEGALKIIAEYVSQVDKVQIMFAEDVKTYLLKEGVIAAFAVVGGAGAITAIPETAVRAARLVGGALVGYNLYCLLSKWWTLRAKIEELRSKARTLQQTYKENTIDVETVKEKIGLLPIDK